MLFKIPGKEISSKKNLLRHIINIHTKNGVVVKKGLCVNEVKVKSFPAKILSACYLCNVQCDSLRVVYQHMEDCHRIDGDFKCLKDGCGAKFLKASTFYHHCEDHAQNKTYTCPNCNKESKSRISHSSHLYHCKTKVSVTCDLCGRFIQRKENLLRHMVNVHKIGKLPPKIPRRKKKLKLVYRTHQNRKPGSSLSYIRNPYPDEPMEFEDSMPVDSPETETMEAQPLLSDFKLESEFWQPVVRIEREN
jgi:hypothetical protein